MENHLTAFLIILLLWAFASGQNSLGVFTDHNDIGTPKNSGSVQYDSVTQSYLMAGSGTNMWFDRDEFHFVWIKVEGDFILNARVRFPETGVEAHRKMGLLARTDLGASAKMVHVTVHGDGLTSLQYRQAAAANTEEIRSTIQGADVLQLQRKGDVYIMSVARFGEPFVREQISGMDLGDELYVGLAVCSHNADVVEKSIFTNVRLIIPAPENFTPYRDYIGSNLETLAIESGLREVVYQSTESLQAPNWTPDGKALIYNCNGLLYRFDLDGNIPFRVNTDFAVHNNNDHVLSFDGKMIAISHHSADDDNKSIVYTLPIQGGKPRRVTALGPSYLHGWSPDGKYVIYTGDRNGNLDIYRIAVKGGKEKRLTDAPGLDDGSEYTPDGRYIYFNSSRSGRMQLWRMQPDGSGQEQITDDAFNNWFPHISPDGKWIVFLSYLPEVKADAHPFYQQVYLRLMPIQGGAARVIAYVYGGQGTINVPSWSPDSRKIAFVSNSRR